MIRRQRRRKAILATVSKTSLLSVIVFSLYLEEALAMGQTDNQPAMGIKVWSVQSGSPAEKAGIKVGDYIFEWKQGNASGTISSPLDFLAIEREYAPRGTVTLTGTATGKAASWTLNGGAWTINGEAWGMKAWATWPEAQPVLERLDQLNGGKQFNAMAEYCKVACASLDASTGARTYAYYFSATRLADGLRDLRQMGQASDFYSKALAAAPTDKASAEIYWAWSRGYEHINDWASASQILQKALNKTEQLAPDSLTTAWMCLYLARMMNREGKLKEAEVLAKRALTLGKAIAPRSYLVGATLNELSVTADIKGDQDTNQKWLKEALPVAAAIDDPNLSSVIYHNLGVGALVQRDLLSAERYLTRGLDIATRSHISDNMKSQLLAALGGVAEERCNFIRAENFLNRALLLNQVDDISLARILGNLANIKSYQGDTVAAINLFGRSIKLWEQVAPKSFGMARDLTNYGLALKAHGDLRQAEEVTSRGVALDRELSPSGARAAEDEVILADVLAAEGKLRPAQRELLKAFPVIEKLERNTIQFASLLALLAGVEQRLGQTSAAMAHYQQAIGTLDSQSVYLASADNVRFSSQYVEIGGNFANLLVKRGDARRAFEVLDHSRARTLVRGLSEKNLDIRAGVPQQLLAQDRETEKKLEDLADQRVNALTERHGKGIPGLERKIASAAADHELAEERIRAASPRYAALTERSLPSLLQLQRSLEPNTAVLEYMAGKERGYLFVVDRHRVASFPLPASSELAKLADSTYELWSQPSHKLAAESAPLRLSKALLGSGWQFIKQHERLIVITEGKLQYIPFVALPIPSSPAVQQPIGARFEVVHLPSASLLVALRQHPTPRNRITDSIAVIGDPVFTNDDPRLSGKMAMPPDAATVSPNRDASDAEIDEQPVSLDEEDIRGLKLGRLIHSREEVEGIASTIASDKLVMALDFDANLKTAVDTRITHSRIVHFATHAFYDPKNPAMSGLVFSLVNKDGRRQPGFLGLDQVYRSHYSADLVVLSACETALGEEASGEGLVGLTWAFINAGARAVVSSLWQVNDASTAELMRVFYAGMQQKGLTPAAALREAQMAIAQKPKWAAPYYWAGFVLEGEYAK